MVFEGINPATAIAEVFEVLSSDGAEAFEALCLREKLLWSCPKCKWLVALDMESCENCKEPAWTKEIQPKIKTPS